MEKFELLKTLINQLDLYYLNNENEKNLDSFITWANMQIDFSKQNDSLNSSKKFGDADENLNISLSDIDNGIAILNGLMYRYGRMYSKVALEHSTSLSIEEFSFLATLSSFSECTKTELINAMIFEKSTGIEIIKRLVLANLASEEINPIDKRSRLLKITQQGSQVLYASFSQMEIVSKEITSVLELHEKKALHYILIKLEKYHRNHAEKTLEKLRIQFKT
jgi:DNA-binding MarR family transcriptional regulator